MKRVLILVMAILWISAPSFAAATPEAAVEAYYGAAAANDVEQLLETIDLEYVEAYIAELELYQLYIESAMAAARTESIVFDNLVLDVDEESKTALGTVEVTTIAIPADTEEALTLENTFVVYLTGRDGEWKVAFTMEKNVYDLEIEAAETAFYAAMTDELVATDSAHYDAIHGEDQSLLVSAGEVDMTDAVVEPDAISSDVETGEVDEQQELDGDPAVDYEKLIEEHESHEERSKILPIVLVLLIAGAGGGGYLYMKRR